MDSQFSQKKIEAGFAIGVSSNGDQPPALSLSLSPDAIMVRYVPVSSSSQVFDFEAPHILAVINHGGRHSESVNENGLNIDVNLPQVFRPGVLEVWSSAAPVLCEQVHGIKSAFTDETVFGCLEVQESSETALEDMARLAYEQIFEYCAQSGFPHLLRMWNYFPHINRDQSGLERYKRFCMGRHQAFSTYYKDFASMLPAASAVGTQDGPFQVLFLAGKQSGKPLENPRQISAYEYPPMYGPESPSFSRATFHRTANGGQLFLAGTASIVGHATQHKGDLAKQTLETLSNIAAVLHRVRHEELESCGGQSAEGLLKVFVRNQEDMGEVKKVLEAHDLGRGPILYLQGEMCRKELLVEIEGIWNLEFIPSR